MVLLVESAGIPAIFLGLFGAIYGLEKERPWLKIVSYVAAAIGVVASVADRGVPNSLAQLMELGSVVGFVVGTCLLARERISGYFWYLVMNASMGWLMFEQGYPLLGWQQIISLAFVVDALRSRLRRHTHTASAPPLATAIGGAQRLRLFNGRRG